MTFDGDALRIDEANLAAYGEDAAKALNITGLTKGSALASEIYMTTRRLQAHHAHLTEKYAHGETVPAFSEWLLDNSYLAIREGLQAASDVKQLKRLPACNDKAALVPLCRALVRSGAGKLTQKRIELFFEGCQRVYVLSRREISILVPVLKLAVISELQQLYSRSEADNSAYIAERLFTSLRALSTLDFSELLEVLDRTEQLFKSDPAGIYPLMSEKTRDNYKMQLERLARRLHVDEHYLAAHILGLAASSRGEAAHIGYYLFSNPLGKEKQLKPGAIYISLIVTATLLLSLLFGFIFSNAFVVFLLLLPFYELVKASVDLILLSIAPPRHIPRLELREGVPDAGRTMCIISSLLTSDSAGEALARKLEEYRLASRDCGENLIFGILADLPDCKSSSSPDDSGFIKGAEGAINALNKKYGGGFFLFIRHRSYNSADKRYTAHERKRGAISELACLLGGKESSLLCLSGGLEAIGKVRYILTLDEDTRLPPGTAKELIGAMLHPLNTPKLDLKNHVVTQGHGIIHPRIATELSACNASAFARSYAGIGGTDPYGSDSSELYMDVFQNGGFAGKGIIHVGAYLECLEGRIPDNLVLSHDALEGAFLRGGYMSDTELIDGFPSDFLSYFRRIHRWTRGDWQNISWLFHRGCHLRHMDRFRLFDSLRRSLMAPATLLAILMSFFLPGTAMTFVGAAALLSLTVRLATSCASALFRNEKPLRQKCHSRVIYGVGEALLQSLFKLLFLPYEAYVCLTATATALWRMFISHRHLLEWTPSSVLERKSKGGAKYFVGMWFSLALGITCAAISPSILGKAAGIFWILTPIIAMDLSVPLKAGGKISVDDKRYLLQSARRIWSFFEDFCTATDHFLPPDNWQEQPPAGIAHRTSPTNIGLCLVCCLSAIDLKLCPEERALGIVENILATLKRMPKWNGHLYNWYDTQTLKPLHPAYVSTVDSGNLAACLIILREGLIELEQYRLAGQCNELLSPMSFAPMYDESRHLFSIGLDLDKNELSNSYYDLMASEARTASFIAIARGEVPRRHWRRLSRAQTELKGYRGMVSWTGSMFEYLMPRLFFKSAPCSLMCESLKFCVGVQKLRTAKQKLPWGISESAFFALDPALNYCYKAHGCSALALKRDMDAELVVSPYSSFLTLCCGVKSAVSNLKALEAYGTVCKYGFWEAVDFTAGRADTRHGETVRCVMAHHLGMSLIAIGNALCGDAMPRRLMRDPSMSAHRCLLDEKLPIGGVVMRRNEQKVPQKPPRSVGVYWEKRGDFSDLGAPECCVLSNGSYSIMLTDSGLTRPSLRGISPYFTPAEAPTALHGIDLYLKREKELIELLPSPDMDKDIKTDWEFTFSGGKINTVRPDFRAQIAYSVSSNVNGEKRVVSLSPLDKTEQLCELIIMLQPLLLPFKDYVNHPAFCKLGMHAKMRAGTVIIRRLSRGGAPEAYMCLAASEPLEVSARRELVPGRGGLLAAIEKNVPSALGWLYDPMLCAKLPIRIAAGTESAVSIALTVGASEDEVYNSACRILTGDSAASSSFPAECALRYKLTEPQLQSAMDLLSALCYPAPKTSHEVYSQSELWKLGISGDLPIVKLTVNTDEELSAAEDMILQHSFLTALGQGFDLALISDEGGDYLRPISNALGQLKRRLAGNSPFVHIIDSSSEISALLSACAEPRERALENKKQYIMSTSPVCSISNSLDYKWLPDGTFEFYVNRSLPPRAWGNMLSGTGFGYFATDCGTGHLWYKNAREYSINRWLCDPLTTEGTEKFEVEAPSRKSLFASPSDDNCTVSYGFGFAHWKKTIDGTEFKTRAFVPPDTNARIIIVEWDDAGSRRLSWYTDLVLGSGSNSIHITHENGVFSAVSSSAPFADAEFRVCAGEAPIKFTSSRDLWLQGKADNKTSFGECLGLVFEAKSPFILVCGCEDEKRLQELAKPDVAYEHERRTTEYWKTAVSAIEIKTPCPELDRLTNGWLLYQTIACRLMGRCSMYQSGGASGFRDQLQDAVNLILFDAAPAKLQILDCCRHQYTEGDVMHWWHSLDTGTRGVRTHCSDDLVWLPWALCEYTEKTGDMGICSIKTDWLSSAPLDSGEHDRYEQAIAAKDEASVLSHAQRALDMVLSRGTGEHGLLKIGNGDWNDGMSQVGVRGKGESVWLTWFFSHTAHRFAKLLKALGDTENAEIYESAAHSLGKAADAAWDGGWFLRGYFDDGSPLGSETSSACKIDSIAQSFSVLCPEAQKPRTKIALSNALARLYSPEKKQVRLFDPPFEDADPSPGYIQSYGPGFRENGGQYTHGAIWLIMALIREDRQDEAFKILKDIIPENHSVSEYEAEPYVIAADVYSNPDCFGKAGWSWYTGSSGWLLRVISEDLLGMKLVNGELTLNPKLPSSWQGCEIKYRHHNGKTELIKIKGSTITREDL